MCGQEKVLEKNVCFGLTGPFLLKDMVHVAHLKSYRTNLLFDTPVYVLH